jgi:hypothetical protein
MSLGGDRNAAASALGVHARRQERDADQEKVSEGARLRDRLKGLGVHMQVAGYNRDGSPKLRPALAPDYVAAMAEADTAGIDTAGTRAALNQQLQQARPNYRDEDDETAPAPSLSGERPGAPPPAAPVRSGAAQVGGHPGALEAALIQGFRRAGAAGAPSAGLSPPAPAGSGGGLQGGAPGAYRYLASGGPDQPPAFLSPTGYAPAPALGLGRPLPASLDAGMAAGRQGLAADPLGFMAQASDPRGNDPADAWPEPGGMSGARLLLASAQHDPGRGSREPGATGARGGFATGAVMAGPREVGPAAQKQATPGQAPTPARPVQPDAEKPAATAQRPYPKAYSEADVDAMTRMIATEARGEGQLGMAAVAHVAMNRLKTGYRRQKSLHGVIYDPDQFSGIYAPVKPEDYRTARAVALAVLNGEIEDPTAGSRHYYAPKAMPKHRPVPEWAIDKEPIKTIGGHVFFKGVP